MFLAQKQFFKSFDPVTGGTYTFGALGAKGSGLPIQGRNGVQTSGASTTVTATDGTPFDPVTVGSIIVFHSPRPDGKIQRVVTAVASGTSITVDSAVTLAAGTAFFFLPFRSGTTDADGFHTTGDLSEITVYIDVEVLGSTSIDLFIQSGGGNMGTPVLVNTNPASGSPSLTGTINFVGRKAFEVLSVCPMLRVGLRATGGPAVDAVTVWAVGKQRLAA